MANINLRPWREERRKERQKQFVGIIAMVCIGSAAIIFGWNNAVQAGVAEQKSRNQFLTEQIAIQKKKISEIKTLQEERDKLIERMNVIQALQGDRPIIVRLFDELARTVPKGIYFEKVTKKDSMVSLNGVSDKPGSISDLLRSLDSSDWFDGAFLKDIKAMKDKDKEQQGDRFNVTVSQAFPKETEEVAKK